MRKTVVALALALGVCLSGLASGAGAQDQPTTTTTVAGGAQPTGGGEAIQGTLRYQDENGDDVFVEGAEIVVETEPGEEVEQVTTDEDGTFRVDVPGPGRYTATIDPDTLPEGVSLEDEDRASLTFMVNAGQARTVQFRITSGEGGGGGDTTLDRALRLTVEGIQFGLIIAICAIGLSLIFGTTGLTNFAHGELVTFGALMAFFFNQTLGLHLLIAAPLAIGCGVLAGFVIDRWFWRPLNRRGTGLVAMLVITIGLGLLLRYIFLFQFEGFSRTYAQFTLQTTGVEIGPVTIIPRDLISIVLSLVVLAGVAAFLQRTRTGKAMRAVADNRDLAESSGIDVERVVGFVWAAGAGLAALGGILLGLSEQVSWLMGFQLLLLMFAGVTLGGIGTAYGALVGSLVVGVFVQLSTLVVAPELKNVGALLILILILLVRPQGILGQSERIG
jgi:neutral amino acid transport system permease protein